jgi:hypothetical protein
MPTTDPLIGCRVRVPPYDATFGGAVPDRHNYSHAGGEGIYERPNVVRLDDGTALHPCYPEYLTVLDMEQYRTNLARKE